MYTTTLLIVHHVYMYIVYTEIHVVYCVQVISNLLMSTLQIMCIYNYREWQVYTIYIDLTLAAALNVVAPSCTCIAPSLVPRPHPLVMSFPVKPHKSGCGLGTRLHTSHITYTCI